MPNVMFQSSHADGTKADRSLVLKPPEAVFVQQGRLLRRVKMRALWREDKVFHGFCNTGQAIKQERRIVQKALATSLPVAENRCSLQSVRSVFHGIQTPCILYGVKAMNDDMNDELLPWPWNDEWLDIGGEG